MTRTHKRHTLPTWAQAGRCERLPQLSLLLLRWRWERGSQLLLQGALPPPPQQLQQQQLLLQGGLLQRHVQLQ